jgi:FixJ family two-component response regulator
MIATSMTSNNPVVFVVDDDARVRDALSSLLAPAGHEVGGLASPRARILAAAA